MSLQEQEEAEAAAAAAAVAAAGITVLRRPVVRNKEYIRRIMEAKNDGADEAFVDQLIEVAKLTKKVRLIPASKN